MRPLLAAVPVVFVVLAAPPHADPTTFLADTASEGSFSQIPRGSLLGEGQAAYLVLDKVRTRQHPGWVDALSR